MHLILASRVHGHELLFPFVMILYERKDYFSGILSLYMLPSKIFELSVVVKPFATVPAKTS